MFEVYAERNDGTRETYDLLTEMQAQCVFFRLRMDPTVDHVEFNEWVDTDTLAA